MWIPYRYVGFTVNIQQQQRFKKRNGSGHHVTLLPKFDIRHKSTLVPILTSKGGHASQGCRPYNSRPLLAAILIDK